MLQCQPGNGLVSPQCGLKYRRRSQIGRSCWSALVYCPDRLVMFPDSLAVKAPPNSGLLIWWASVSLLHPLTVGWLLAPSVAIGVSIQRSSPVRRWWLGSLLRTIPDKMSWIPTSVAGPLVPLCWCIWRLYMGRCHHPGNVCLICCLSRLHPFELLHQFGNDIFSCWSGLIGVHCMDMGSPCVLLIFIKRLIPFNNSHGSWQGWASVLKTLDFHLGVDHAVKML